MLKKLIATALAAAMIFGLVSVGFAATSPFPDTAGVEQEAAIAKLKTLGLVKGDENGNFRPYSTINRAEFTAMVVRMLNLETAASYLNTPTVFPDVTEQWSWAYGYINVATGRGLIKGFEDGTFRPGEPVTQAQALTILIRALGYNDNLPGDWPIDYVMKGAELGIIGGGFTGNVGATRALVAELVANTLDQTPVKEDKEAPGNFGDKYTTPGVTLYKEAFFGTGKLANDDYASGKVTKVNTTDKTITIDGIANPVSYVSGVVLYGKDSISELVGQYVKATLNKDGKIIFIQVTTPGEVVGRITAIDAVNKTVTVGGTKHTVDEGAVILKNGAELSGTFASKLAEIKDADAKLLKDDDGVVYRIEARILDKSGTLYEKSTVWQVGKVIYRINFEESGTWFILADDAVIVRNGVAASFGDLESGDSLEYALDENDEIVYIDAYSKVLEGYTLISMRWTSAGRVVTLEKDGKEVSYTISDDYNKNLKTDGKGLDELLVGTKYDITLDRDGEIICMVPAEPEGVTTGGEVKKVVAKYTSGTSSNRQYKLELDDGTVLILNELDLDPVGGRVDILINGEDYNHITEPKDLWNAIAVGSLVIGDEDLTYLKFYSPSVTGKVYKTGSGSTLTLHIVPDDPDEAAGMNLVSFVWNWDTAVTINGKRVDRSLVLNRIPTDSSNDAFVGTVKFSGDDDESGVPVAAELTLEDFMDREACMDVPVESVEVRGSTYYYTLRTFDGTTGCTVSSSAIVLKDGEAAARADVVVGDKVSYSPPLNLDNVEGYEIPAYVKAKSDTEAPKLVTNTTLTATWLETDQSAHKGTLTVSFRLTEPVAVVYIWVDGSEYELDVTDPAAGITFGTTWIWTLRDVAKPAKVSAQFVDFAGNSSSVYSFTFTN
ncbi:MAG TPA: S-layer homology domain-containing protein [Firmicutes bacterium]|nr:S-layer homology domain-containing protein [Candidatus Fermentithermobacillaceae bacterium]